MEFKRSKTYIELQHELFVGKCNEGMKLQVGITLQCAMFQLAREKCWEGQAPLFKTWGAIGTQGPLSTPLFLSFSLFVYLCLSLSLSLSLFLSFSFSLSISLSVSCSVTISLYLCLYVSVPLSPFHFLSFIYYFFCNSLSFSRPAIYPFVFLFYFGQSLSY